MVGVGVWVQALRCWIKSVVKLIAVKRKAKAAGFSTEGGLATLR